MKNLPAWNEQPELDALVARVLNFAALMACVAIVFALAVLGPEVVGAFLEARQ